MHDFCDHNFKDMYEPLWQLFCFARSYESLRSSIIDESGKMKLKVWIKSGAHGTIGPFERCLEACR